MKIKYGKKKAIKTSGDWKMYSMEMTVDLPKMIAFHVRWAHPDNFKREEILGSYSIDQSDYCEENTYLMYRALMLEAGFVPAYFWYQEIPHVMDSLTYTFPKKKLDERIKEWQKTKTK